MRSATKKCLKHSASVSASINSKAKAAFAANAVTLPDAPAPAQSAPTAESQRAVPRRLAGDDGSVSTLAAAALERRTPSTQERQNCLRPARRPSRVRSMSRLWQLQAVPSGRKECGRMEMQLQPRSLPPLERRKVTLVTCILFRQNHPGGLSSRHYTDPRKGFCTPCTTLSAITSCF